MTPSEHLFKGFDTTQLRTVASVLMITNPRVGKNVGSVMAHIRDIAVANIRDGDATYVSTLGFTVCGYWYCGNKNDWRYYVTLDAWGVLEYLEGNRGNASINLALGKLRHAYEHMTKGTMGNPAELARGLIGPAIVQLEKVTTEGNMHTFVPDESGLNDIIKGNKQ